MSSKLKTVTGEELMSMDLPPIRMIVEKLLPQGLHILAGAPKTGKSWLTLWICLQVSKGEPVWDLPTEKGTVLYLCLEDSFSRIQGRIDDLTDVVSSNIHFATMAETINNGLIAQIIDFLEKYPDTVLVAIDTLQRVRNALGDMNAYAKDYEDTNLLKQIADEYNIAILLIHHLRKQSDSDIFNMISGTAGLIGGADGSYVLERDFKQPGFSRFWAKGRDIEELKITLEFDKETHIWKFISDDSDDLFSIADDEAIRAVINFIKAEKHFTGKASQSVSKREIVAGADYKNRPRNAHAGTIACNNLRVPRILIALFRLYAKQVSANSPRTFSMPLSRQYAESICRLMVPKGCSTISFRFRRSFLSGA